AGAEPQVAVGARRDHAGGPDRRHEFRDLAAGRDAPDVARDRVGEPHVAVRPGRDGRRAEAPPEAERRQGELGNRGRHPATFQGRDLGAKAARARAVDGLAVEWPKHRGLLFERKMMGIMPTRTSATSERMIYFFRAVTSRSKSWNSLQPRTGSKTRSESTRVWSASPLAMACRRRATASRW